MPSKKNNYIKGRRNEIRSRKWFEERGYMVIRAAGSKGAWDLVCVSEDRIVLVQVKTNHWPSPAEREEMLKYPHPKNCHKVIHRWDDYAKQPRIGEVAPTKQEFKYD